MKEITEAKWDPPPGKLNRGNGREGLVQVLSIENLHTAIPLPIGRSKHVLYALVNKNSAVFKSRAVQSLVEELRN